MLTDIGFRAVVRPGTNSLAFFKYVNKTLVQFILQKLLSSNVVTFWSLLLFESAVRSLGLLPRVFSILKLHNYCCDLKKPQFTKYSSPNNHFDNTGSDDEVGAW